MKLNSKKLSKSILAIVLSVCMLVSCMTVGFISTDAAQVEGDSVGVGNTIYLAISGNALFNYGGNDTSVYVNVKKNEKSNEDNWTGWKKMTSTNKFYGGKRLYTISDLEGTNWGGLGRLQFKLQKSDGTQADFVEVFGGDSDMYWVSDSDYANKVYDYVDRTWSSSEYSDASFATGFTLGNYYIHNNVTGAWYGNDVDAPIMTKSNNTYYYDFYLKKDEVDSTDNLIFKFWDSSDSLQIGPDWVSGNRKILSTSGSWDSSVQDITAYGDKNTVWKVSTGDFASNKFYRVRITLDPITLENSRNGRVKFESSQLSDLAPTFSTTTFDIAKTYNLTSLVGFTSGSNVGTVSYDTYQYYDTGWHTIQTPAAWTPPSTNVTKLKVTATDGGVITTAGTTKNAITARTETKETAITVQAVLPRIDSFTVGGSSSKTLNIGETAALATQIANAGGNSVTYTSSDDTKVSIVNGNVKALAPCSNVTITASLQGATDKTVTVSVTTPSLNLSYDPASFYANGYTTSPTTVTANNVHTGTSIKGLSYSITAGNDYATINTSTGVLTSTSTAGSVTVKVTGAVSYNGVTYSGAIGTANVTVKPIPTVKLSYNVTEIANVDMAYDATVSAQKGNHIVYKLERFWKGNSQYNFEVNVTENGSTTNYHMDSSSIRDSYPLSGTGYLLYDNSANWVVMYTNSSISSSQTAKYTLYFDFTDKKLYVEYPYVVTFNANGHGTNSTQIVTYGDKATAAAPTEPGYSLVGWYKESTLETAFIFSTETITSNLTLYAKWQALTFDNIKVVRRFFRTGDTNAYITDAASDAIQTINGVGPERSQQVEAVAETAVKNSGNYTFEKFVLPAGVALSGSGSVTTKEAFNITATAGDLTIFVDYRETLYTLTLNNQNDRGVIKKSVNDSPTGDPLSTVQVGNVTGVTLKAIPNTGYSFNTWEATVNASNVSHQPSDLTTDTVTFYLTGNATVTAKYTETTHVVSLIKRYYALDGTTLLKTEEIAYRTYDVGLETQATIVAPRVTNCEFLRFTPEDSSLLEVVSGTYASGNVVVKGKTNTTDTTIYAEYRISGDISVYIDMNGNTGTPILNLKYFAKSTTDLPVPYNSVSEGGLPVQPANSNEKLLPYEMDLMSGSESVYHFTLKLKKLREDYYIGEHEDQTTHTIKSDPIVISYISVGNNNIGENDGGFTISTEALVSGEVWYKADSTTMSTFEEISYGSVTNYFIAMVGDGGNGTQHTLLQNAVKSVTGTAVHSEEDGIYQAQYAGLYTLQGAQTHMVDFKYVLKTTVNEQIVVKDENDPDQKYYYYFDKWIKCSTENITFNGVGTALTAQIAESEVPDGYKGTADLNFTKAPEFSRGDSYYIALYKAVSDQNSKVRLKITYHFNDYDTSDGNYVFDETKNPENQNEYLKVTPATYVKYVTTDMTSYPSTYDPASIASVNVPYIKSNYFDYTFNRAVLTDVPSQEQSELEAQKLILVDAYLTETARSYKILFNKSGNVETKTGFYQNSVVLEAPSGISNPVWKMKVVKDDGTSEYVIVGTGSTFTARYMAVGTNDESTLNDCQVITVTGGSGTPVNYRSDIYNSYTEHYYSGDTEMLRHNFYIIDYCGEGELVGGGVLYATTDGTDYRQANARAVLEAGNDHTAVENRLAFINSILSAPYDTEYKAQSINNVGFRYKPFKDTEDVFRYSTDLSAYLTTYEGTNTNSTNYAGQKLRLFSFMVYNAGTAQSPSYHIVCSDGYAEVSRYIPQS